MLNRTKLAACGAHFWIFSPRNGPYMLIRVIFRLESMKYVGHKFKFSLIECEIFSDCLSSWNYVIVGKAEARFNARSLLDSRWTESHCGRVRRFHLREWIQTNLNLDYFENTKHSIFTVNLYMQIKNLPYPKFQTSKIKTVFFIQILAIQRYFVK